MGGKMWSTQLTKKKWKHAGNNDAGQEIEHHKSPEASPHALPATYPEKITTGILQRYCWFGSRPPQ